ncbi:MAG TPA: FtsQ-type POTRA domain-containing protein, partial [Polyangiales bacterium]|nr:FtsQ-type POTRA domain-containing protein [Polyangiales bacterium]
MPTPSRTPWSIRLRASIERVRPKLLVLPRVLIGTLQLALTAGLLFVLYAAASLLLSHVRSAPSFAIGRIDISGASQLSRAEVEHIAGLAVGQNIFEISEDEVRRRLAAEPWIESASVERHLPSSYVLHIK